MEFPRTALIIQRILAIILLTIVVAIAVVERRSPFSRHVRDLKPWPFWLSVKEPGKAAAPTLHLGVYRPVSRSLVLIRIPDTVKLQGKVTAAKTYIDALRATDDAAAAERAVISLAEAKISSLSLEPISWEHAGRLSMNIVIPENHDEPAVEAALALRTPSLKRSAESLEALLLALELRHVPLNGLEPAVLPEDPQAPAFLASAFAAKPEPRGEEKPTVAEVLNGTGLQGLATAAAKVLRSNGVDVMMVGQASQPRVRTVVFDRTGDFVRAARVRAALGCPTAIAATRIDPLRGVDASVELGDDCSY